MAQKPVLGKGLASLFPTMPSTTAAPQQNPAAPISGGTGAISAGPATTVSMADTGGRIPGISIANIDDLEANDYQPRRDFDEQALNELSQSILANGIIQPLIVRKNAMGRYQLIAGERRLRAAKLAGLKQVPIVIRRSTDKEALELALVENIQRRDLNCIDEALAYFQLINDFNLTQEEVSTRVGKERATVANHLRLLKLPEAIIDDLRKQTLSFGHGKVLLSLEDQELRLRARAQIIQNKLSVRESEALVDALKKQSDQRNAGTEAVPSDSLSPSLKLRFQTLSDDITRYWSTRVQFKGNEEQGKILIHYGSREELERLIQAMQNRRLWETQPN